MRTVAMGLVAVLALAGCTGGSTDKSAPEPSPSVSPSPVAATASPKAATPVPSPSPSPTAFESFPPPPPNESKDQAAIRAAWMKYWQVYQKFASNPHGYTDFTETQLVTTGEESQTIIKMIVALRERGLRSGGGSKFVNVSISKPLPGPNGRTATITYCIDGTNLIVYDAKGVPLKRDPKFLNETATMLEMKDGTWRVASTRNEYVEKC